MDKFLSRIYAVTTEIAGIVLFCVNLSWKSSVFFTITRMICSALIPLTGFVQIYINKGILDYLSTITVTSGELSKNTAIFVTLFACALSLGVLRSVAVRFQQYSQLIHDELMSAKINLLILDVNVKVDLEYFDDNKFYNKMSAASMNAMELTRMSLNIVSSVSALIGSVTAVYLISAKNVFYCLILLTAGIPSSVIAARHTRRVFNMYINQIEEDRKRGYVSSLAMSKQYAQEIRLYNAGNLLKARYMKIWDNIFSQRKKIFKGRAIALSACECLPEIALIYVGLDTATKIMRGYLTVGDFALYTGLAGQLWSYISILSNSVTQFYDNKLKVENFRSLSKIKQRVPDNGQRSLVAIESIAFENVCFAYPDTTVSVLNNVTFSADKNEKIIFVGLNGSGKSTLVKLLLRFYDVSSGVIKINGIDIKEYRLTDLRRCFSVYFQEAFNYSFTVRDNFSVSDVTYDSEQNMLESLKKSGIKPDLEILPFGLDTYLSRIFTKNGVELSIGQSQKIALARSLYRRHSVLIMDEPSSSLDPKSEHELFQKLRESVSDKIAIFIAHRLTNVSLADKIYVLEDGRIIESGSQNELLRKCGRYAELFEYQQSNLINTEIVNKNCNN